MSCSGDIVTIQYLEQRLQEFSNSPAPEFTNNVSEALIREGGGVGALIARLVGAAVSALGSSLITAIGRAESALTELAESQRQQRQEQLDSAENVKRIDQKVDEIERIESQNKRLIDSLEGDVRRLNGDITSLKSRLDEEEGWTDIFREYRIKAILDRVDIVNDIIFLKADTEENTRILEELAESTQRRQRRQDERLDFIDESFRELALVNEIYLREFGGLFAQLTGSISEDKQAIYRLQQDLAELRNQPLPSFPQPSPPRISTSTDDSGFAINITTDGGTATERVQFPSLQNNPSLRPDLTLDRSGQTLIARLAIAGFTESDSVELPQVDEDQEFNITRIIERTVNLEELQQAAQRIEANQSGLFGAIATVGTIGVNTFNRVDPARLAEAASTGACNTLNGGCGQNFRSQIKADGLQNLQTLDTAGTAGILAQVATVKNNLDTLSNNLGLDRALNAYNLAVSTHNAVCLSRAVGETFTYVVDNVALASGFQWLDTEGNPITFSGALGNSFQGFMQDTLGTSLYNSSIADFNKALRVYQTGQNVAWAVRGIVDPIQNIATTAADNTGKIGNALRSSGAVLENSYSILPEQNTIQSATQAKLSTFTRSLEGVGEGLELFGEGTENIIEIQQTRLELQESSNQFNEAIANATSDDESSRTTGKDDSQPPEISLLDLVPQPVNP